MKQNFALFYGVMVSKHVLTEKFMAFQNMKMLSVGMLALMLLFTGCRVKESPSRSSAGQAQSASSLAFQLQEQLIATQDSLELANEVIATLRSRAVIPGDSLLRQYALSMAFNGRSKEAATLINIIDGRTRNLNFTERRGSVFLTLILMAAILLGFLYVGLRALRRLITAPSDLMYNRAIAVVAGLLIYFVFSMAGLSIPVLFLNSLAIGRPLYSVTMNFLALFTGALSTMFIGRMLLAEGERTILLGIIFGVFTCTFFLDMLFRALFSAFEMSVLLPNTMFVIGVVLVYLFGPRTEKFQDEPSDRELNIHHRYQNMQ